MNAKEFLSRGRYLESHVKSLTEHIEYYRSLVNSCSLVYSDVPRSTVSGDKLEDCTQKIIDLQTRLGDDMADLVRVKCEISEAIRHMENYENQDILVKRYVCNKSWETIAAELGYSVPYIYRRHGEALKEFAAAREKASK